MTQSSSFDKRVKRHVVGRTHVFFAVTAPGFENICAAELRALSLPIEKLSVTAGGVEFEGRLADCYTANLCLRSASRILMRLFSLRATNFNQLNRKMIDFPWELYLQPDRPIKFQVTARHCRLYHKDALAERCLRSIQNRLADFEESPPPSAETAQTIYIRGTDDRFSISIDSSGDNLYKRGWKKHTGKAPLRETLAAAILMQVGYSGREPLIDPMCGTGTFSLEAALIARNIPPGWLRGFAFMGWPSFREKQWHYLRRQFESGFKKIDRPLITALDSDASACKKLAKCLQDNSLTHLVTVINQDFFEFNLSKINTEPGIIVINPPYGLRIGGAEQSAILFRDICKKLKKEYSGWKVALIAPNRQLAKTVPFPLKSFPVAHGGLTVTLLTGKIP